MQKILLIGELAEIVRSINECLENDFQVQLCSEHIEMIKGIAKIFKPDMIVVCQIGIDELDSMIFTWSKECMPKTPVLVISTVESWGQISRYCMTGQFDKMFRPVTGQEMVAKCRQMIAEGVQEKQVTEETMQIPEVEENTTADSQKEVVIEQTKQEKVRYKIMIVDDSPLVLRNLKSELEADYNVFLAPSGEKALELIPKKQPDLLLLDYEMPGMDGRDVFETMLADNYMKTIPVIFLTSIAQKEQVYGVLKSVPAGYILKPADTDRLMESISKILK